MRWPVTDSNHPPDYLQDGSYLAELLLSKGYEVHGIIRRSSSFNTSRIRHLYEDPLAFKQGKNFQLHYGDLTDSTCLVKLIHKIKPSEVYNLGAQSHVKVRHGPWTVLKLWWSAIDGEVKRKPMCFEGLIIYVCKVR